MKEKYLQLHDEVVVCTGLIEVMQTDDIGMFDSEKQ